VTTDITAAVANACVMSVVEVMAYNTTSEVASGSGVIYQIDQDGNALILTNYHVIVGNGVVPRKHFSLRIYGQQEDTYISAEYVGGSSTYDVAVLKVTESAILKNANAKAVTINTSSPTLGETCIAIGNPDTFGVAVNKGVVSKDSEYVNMTIAQEKLPRRLIRHDAYISGGSSGGGLFDINGHLIGLTCGGKDGTDIHYAIPSSIVDVVVKDILENIDNEEGIKPTTAVLGIEIDWVPQPYFNPESGKVEIIDTVTIKQIDDGIIARNGVLAVDDQIVSIVLNPSSANEKTITLSREFELKELLITISANTTLTINAKRAVETDGTTTIQNIAATITITSNDIEIVK
jgi:S1-C subfamily serine protease